MTLGGENILAGFDLSVRRGEILALLGPSGCGKTTLLRAVAGLLRPDAGSAHWSGYDLRTVPAHRRRFGMVFQDHALLPHRNVAANVAFGLRMQGVPAAERARRVGEMLTMVGLEGYQRRNVATLSGGEAQRVALARALAPEPKLLLADEPFAALDRPLHDRLVSDVRRILAGLEQTAIHVTHDHAEAFALADRVALMPTAGSTAPPHRENSAPTPVTPGSPPSWASAQCGSPHRRQSSRIPERQSIRRGGAFVSATPQLPHTLSGQATSAYSSAPRPSVPAARQGLQRRSVMCVSPAIAQSRRSTPQVHPS